ncbi:MAG TPA: tRNA 2-selenouridine(34) synthase MnmH [Desulfuromonadales bacterium]|nr:tRNA 2-selenouridine(34) synthase MnmH [Desulfuromonadales bacterium]
MIPQTTVSLDKALAFRDQGALLVDVRSPAEYVEATIPGALNVPLFDDEERARVGITYKEEGAAAARLLAMDLVAPRIPAMVRSVRAARGDSGYPVVVFCWRGGLRSRAITSFLELAGVPARQLIGGHKAFRAHVREFLARGEWGRLLVLRGLTGVGKTRLLAALAEDGYPILDLEGLANHRGSAFGALGLPPQPSQKAFEAHIWDILRKVPPGSYALSEGESRNIGKLILPDAVYQSLQVETSVWVEASLDYRVSVILEDYPACDELRKAFVGPVKALRRRLGGETVERFLAMLDSGDWRNLVRELMVLYYDPLYNHTKPAQRIEVDIEPLDVGMIRLKEAIAQILSCADEPSRRKNRGV